MAISGGAPVTIADVAVPQRGASWGEDDTILYIQLEGIMQVSGTGGTPTLLIPSDDEPMYGTQMLPGGEWVLFNVKPNQAQTWDGGHIVVQSLTSGVRKVLVDGGRDGRHLSTGHLVYSLDCVLFAVLFDASSVEVSGGPVPLLEDVRPAAGFVSGASQFAVSRSGALVYVPGYSRFGTLGVESVLVWVDRDGREEPIGAERALYTWPRL